MIKSSKLSLKFTNDRKVDKVRDFVKEYRRVAGLVIGGLWDNRDNLKKYVDPKVWDSIDTKLSARVKQALGKQLIGIVSGTIKKNKKREYVYEQLVAENKLRRAEKLKKIIDEARVSCPNVDNIHPQIDSRFFILEKRKTALGFDLWLRVSSLGTCKPFYIPLNKHRHFNLLNDAEKWDIMGSIILTEHWVSFSFEHDGSCTDKEESKVMGIDIGQKTMLSCSDEQESPSDQHGWNLDNISNVLEKKQYNSKAYKRAASQRNSYINWAIKQIDLKDYAQINLENLGTIAPKSKRLASWNYGYIKDKIEGYLLLNGVRLKEVNPTYTSQRCFNCGWVRKRNRRSRDNFKCSNCGHTAPADLNAAKNIALDLPPIPKRVRLSRMNMVGFYWQQDGIKQSLHIDSSENMVPDTQKDIFQQNI